MLGGSSSLAFPEPRQDLRLSVIIKCKGNEPELYLRPCLVALLHGRGLLPCKPKETRFRVLEDVPLLRPESQCTTWNSSKHPVCVVVAVNSCQSGFVPSNLEKLRVFSRKPAGQFLHELVMCPKDMENRKYDARDLATQAPPRRYGNTVLVLSCEEATSKDAPHRATAWQDRKTHNTASACPAFPSRSTSDSYREDHNTFSQRRRNTNRYGVPRLHSVEPVL